MNIFRIHIFRIVHGIFVVVVSTISSFVEAHSALKKDRKKGVIFKKLKDFTKNFVKLNFHEFLLILTVRPPPLLASGALIGFIAEVKSLDLVMESVRVALEADITNSATKSAALS